MLSRGPRPRNNSIPSRDHSPHSPHPSPQEVARALITVTEILATSAEIIRRLGDERGLPCLPTATLDRVSALSESLWEKVNSDDTIDVGLGDLLLQYQEALDLLKSPTGQRSSPNSTQFFPNARNIIISGGSFSTSTSNPVVHDPVVRELCHKILYTIRLGCVVLFS